MAQTKKPEPRARLAAGVAFLLASLFVVALRAGDELEAARAFFSRYQDLERAYAPALADLYSDEAVIHLAGPTPEGRMQYFTVPGEVYKGFLRQSMPQARKRGDYSRYREVSYERDGSTVRIEGIRRSVWKDYERPFSMRIQKNENGRWLIIEEQQSIPANAGEG